MQDRKTRAVSPFPMAHPARTNSLFPEKTDQRGRLSQFGLHDFVQIKQNVVKSRDFSPERAVLEAHLEAYIPKISKLFTHKLTKSRPKATLAHV
ncbi:MAG: hypothetical protein J5791_04435 [Fibrobacter sp.]|nr:hypothetical protein [Fibrobacter sp.]